MWKTVIRSTGLLFVLLFVLLALFSPTQNFTAQAAVNDTPATFVSDSAVSEWTMGNGLVYWGYNCVGAEIINPELNDWAVVKRKPASGGAQRQLDPTNEDDSNHCYTYLKMTSSSDGLYYYEEAQGATPQDPHVYHIMRIPLSSPFTPREVKVLASNEVPTNAGPFVEANGFLYWAEYNDNRILRVRKNGNGDVETVVNTSTSPLALLIVGNTIYWSDSTGLHAKSLNCDQLPCAGGSTYRTLSGGGITRLLYVPVSSNNVLQQGFRLYWVEGTSAGPGHTNFAIKYRFCSFIAICGDIIADPGVQAASVEPASVEQVNDDVQTLYSGATDWSIGDLVLANGDIFWTETNHVGANGSLKHKPATADEAVAAQEIASEQSAIDPRLFVVNDKIMFARTGIGIFTLPLNASPILRDLDLNSFEVTQGIQNLANEVPLVADKTTYVRAYGMQLSGPSTPNVEVQLFGSVGGNALPGSPLKPVNGVRGLNTGAGYDRAYLNNGWYFLLPANWTHAGNVDFRLVIDPRHQHTDPNLDNNQKVQTINFQSQPPVCVMTVPVRTHNPIPSTTDPNFWKMVDQFDRRWPVPQTWIYRDTEPVEELEVCTWHYIPYPCYGPYELSDGWGITNGIPDRDKVIASLWTRALLSFNPDACDDIGAPVQFMGMVHPDADNGGASGYASTVSSQSWVQLPGHGTIGTAWNAMEEGSTMAQELAHNHGRKHVDCGGPDNIDSSYPYPPCQIGPIDAAGYYGFDRTSLQPIRPNGAADFMSYAYNTWVSDYTWKALLNSFAATSAASASAASLPTANGDQVFVTGMVDGEHERGEITQILILPGETIPTTTLQMAASNAANSAGTATVDHGDDPHVAYKLRLLDAGGTTLIERPLTLQPLDDHSEESLASIFVDIFPKPAQAVATILLLAGDTPVYTVTAGVAEPVVHVLAPVAGANIANQLTIQWTASDPDPADRLKFAVQYSHDNGVSWHTVAINVPSTPDVTTTLTLNDLGSLSGSAPNAAKVRVLASDGYNTAIAESQNFTVQNRPPLPAIVAPGEGDTVLGGEPLLLQGMATDPEDGGLGADALKWQVDGVDVGTGLAVMAAGLGSSNHSAALAATDANSQTVTTTVNFAIAPVSIPLGATPALDGLCEESAYAAAANLALKPYGDATQANVHLLRSADYLWLCFTDLKTGAATPGAYVGLRADTDNSRQANAQDDDAGFFVAEDGSVFTRAGNGNGDLVEPGPEGLAAQIVISGTSWTAELRIDKAQLGGWDHLINFAIGHHSLNAEDDDYTWPYRAGWANPTTWSEGALGLQPVIYVVNPATAPALGASFTLTVTGSNLVSGTQVLWNGQALATTWITDGVLSAQVTNTLLTTAGTAQITAKAPAPSSLVSNALPFVVAGATPVINNLSPDKTSAGGNGLTLTIHGANFAPDAKVLWNDTELTPQSISATQITVQISAALLVNGKTVGIAVGNPTPTAQISALQLFNVVDQQTDVFIPGLYKNP